MTDDQAAKTPPGDAPSAARVGGGRAKLIVAVVGVLALGAGAKLFLLTPAGRAGACSTATTVATAAPSAPLPPAGSGAGSDDCPAELGPVLKLDPVMINLADGHYLQLGLALQLAAGTDLKQVTDESGGGARALDAAVARFGTQTYGELVTPAAREVTKRELARAVVAAYDGAVSDIYFTSFVMQ